MLADGGLAHPSRAHHHDSCVPARLTDAVASLAGRAAHLQRFVPHARRVDNEAADLALLDAKRRRRLELGTCCFRRCLGRQPRVAQLLVLRLADLSERTCRVRLTDALGLSTRSHRRHRLSLHFHSFRR